MNEKTKENQTMSILYFIGIIIVVLGHNGKNGGLQLFADWFPYYLFNVPFLIFLSGYLYKEKDEENVTSFFKRKFKKLLIPYYI